MNTKKKIILFAPSICNGGGTERVLVNLANELVFNWDIIIAVNSIGNKNLYQLHKSVKVKKYGFGSLRVTYQKNILIKIINKLFGTFILSRFLNNSVFKDTSLIICFSPDITNNCFKTKFKDRLISFEHWPYSAYNKYPKVQNRIQKNFPLLKKVIVLTKHEKEVYESFGCNVIIIPNAFSFFPENPSKLENKVVLSIGHFNEQKRRDLLIESWSFVNKKHPDWKLHIVGDGHQKEEAVEQIGLLGLNNSIKIINPTEDILSHYLQSSIFVLSSEFESFSLVLLEAKAAGLPCVSFDVVCGPSEVMQDNKDGFLVDFPDVQEMADKINVLIENKTLRKEFGHVGRQDAQERYNPKLIYSKWTDFLEHEIV